MWVQKGQLNRVIFNQCSKNVRAQLLILLTFVTKLQVQVTEGKQVRSFV